MELSDCQDCDARKTNQHFSHRKNSTTKKFLIPTLMEEIKLVILVKYEFE